MEVSMDLVPLEDVIMIRALLCGVYIRALDFWKLPCGVLKGLLGLIVGGLTMAHIPTGNAQSWCPFEAVHLQQLRTVWDARLFSACLRTR